MRIVWSREARDDLDAIVDWIRADDPTAARRVAAAIVRCGEILRKTPRIGRPGRVAETRELVVTSLPYLVIYKIDAASGAGKADIAIVRVIHGARLWPPSLDLDE